MSQEMQPTRLHVHDPSERVTLGDLTRDCSLPSEVAPMTPTPWLA